MDIKIFYDNNSLNKNKLRESWFNKYHHDEYLHVKEFQDNNNLSEIKFSQVLYSYINNLEILPKGSYEVYGSQTSENSIQIRIILQEDDDYTIYLDIDKINGVTVG